MCDVIYKHSSILYNVINKDTSMEQQSLLSLPKVINELKMELNDLLNHRRNDLNNIGRSSVCASSILNYGLPDLTHYNPLSENDRKIVRQLLLQALHFFSPRLQNVSIVDVDQGDQGLVAIMCFEVKAKLMLTQSKINVCFNSTIHPNKDNVKLHNFKEMAY